jgi:hypothetical protein
MSIWKKLFGNKDQSTAQPTRLWATAKPSQSSSPSSQKQPKRDTTGLFIWNADTMPMSYGQVAHDALTSVLREVLKPDPKEVLAVVIRAGDLMDKTMSGNSPSLVLKTWLTDPSREVSTADLAPETKTAVLSGKLPGYVPYLVVLNLTGEVIAQAHQELLQQKAAGYCGVILFRSPLDLAAVEKHLSLPLRNLQLSSGRIDPNNPEVVRLLEEARKAQRPSSCAPWKPAPLPEQLAICDRILVIDPECSDAHYLRAEALQKADRTDEAEAEYRIAIRADKRNINALWGLARLMSNKRNYREAIALFDQVIALAPEGVQMAVHERKQNEFWANGGS